MTPKPDDKRPSVRPKSSSIGSGLFEEKLQPSAAGIENLNFPNGGHAPTSNAIYADSSLSLQEAVYSRSFTSFV
jgi:hypothetical protein